MPSPAELKKRGGVVKVRTKRLSNGTLLRIYIVKGKGKRGGHSIAEQVRKPPSGKTKRS